MNVVTAMGATFFIIGFVGMVGAMMFGTTDEGGLSVVFRGSFQEAKDYTPDGWRYYKAALCCALFGFGLVAVGVFIP